MLGEGAPSLKFFDVRQGLPLLPYAYPNDNNVPYWNDNNQQWYLASNNAALVYTRNRTTGGWGFYPDIEASVGQEAPAIIFSGTCNAAAISDRHVAIAGTSPYVYVYALPSLSIVEVDANNMGGVTCLAFSPDGRKLAGFCMDKTSFMRVWDIEGGTWAEASQYPQASISSSWSKAAFTADGKYIFLTYSHYSNGERTAVYDAETLEMLASAGLANNLYQPDATGKCVAHPLRTSSVLCCTSTTNTDRFIYEHNCATGEYTAAVTQQKVKGALPYTANNIAIYDMAVDAQEQELYGIFNIRNSSNNVESIHIMVFDLMTYAFKRHETIQGGVKQHCQSFRQRMLLLNAGAHQITGTVRDINNAPCARQVRAHRRSDGVCMAQTMSDASTGDYRLLLPDAGPYDVQFQALDGELLNDLLFARSEPEPIGG